MTIIAASAAPPPPRRQDGCRSTYAHRHAGDYDLVWWFDAEHVSLIPDQFAALSEQMGLLSAKDPDAVRAAVHNALAGVPGWLLVFDNGDDAARVAEWIPSLPIHRGHPGHVIVTTRRGGFDALGTVLDLDVMDLDDAVRLLRTRLPGGDPSALTALAKELGFLPLALEQAAAYLSRTRMPPCEYLAAWRTRSADMHGRGRPTHHRETLATLWDLSLERIGTESRAAVQLLDICAYLAPEPIPLDLFTAHPDQLPSALSRATSDPLAFAETVALLLDYSLIKRDGDTIQLHRLVQDVIRAHHASRSLDAWWTS